MSDQNRTNRILEVIAAAVETHACTENEVLPQGFAVKAGRRVDLGPPTNKPLDGFFCAGCGEGVRCDRPEIARLLRNSAALRAAVDPILTET